ncbi:hypothetical protein ALC57_14067 [Trachymyrmex cornetzi]|uniref:Uncharacterized protein n=1 Tax=Trachymyrmex cornetzi TaxID=471704 RepID=A0A151IZ14_9HYME|nr:hypothetical protein ALC57_14067 [Trachymyrmex cornetzi]
MQKYGLSLQPFVIIQGPTYTNINKIFVSFEDVLYEPVTFLKALDICFQLAHVLNLNYQNVLWIKVNNIIFKPKLVIQIDRDSYGDPIFGIIKHILYKNDNEIFVIYMYLHCHGINKHFEAYVIDKSNNKEYSIINIKELYTLPTIIHKGGNGNQYISNMNQD